VTVLSMVDWASPQQLKQLAKDYRAAVDLIDQRGWVRGAAFDENGSLCGAGALGIVCGLTIDSGFAGRLNLAFSAFYRTHKVLISEANDKCRSWDDMRSMMLGIADEAEKASRV